MLLSDPRLRFAQEMIAHWTQIRRADLVPAEDDLDPRMLTGCLRFITIVAVGRPDAATIELVFPEISRRYGRDMRKVDSLQLFAPEERVKIEETKRLVLGVPCGTYGRFVISAGEVRVVETEALSLPMRGRGQTKPGLLLSLSHDIRPMAEVAPTVQRRMERTFGEFVDIGAGAPPAIP
jgi:hypothetical protein